MVPVDCGHVSSSREVVQKGAGQVATWHRVAGMRAN